MGEDFDADRMGNLCASSSYATFWSAMRFKHSKAIELSLRCQPDSLVRDGRPVLAPFPLSGLGRVLHQFSSGCRARFTFSLHYRASVIYSDKVEEVAG